MKSLKQKVVNIDTQYQRCDDMTKVGVIHNKDINYCQDPPFHPDSQYPEYPFETLSKQNKVYNSIRDMFRQLDYDKDNFNHPDWNPLKDYVTPGDHVFIKPNLVYHKNQNDALITHGSIIRAMLDYIIIALKGKGKVLIGDSPIQGADFEKIKMISGLNEILEFTKKISKIEIEVIDLRKEWVKTDFSQKSIIEKIKIRFDNSDYIAVDLGCESKFCSNSKPKNPFKVSMYPHLELNQHHNNSHHEYLISKDVLNANVIINLPKLKTHKIAGITSSLKNLIGINGDKNWIPHYSLGSVEEGGDEYRCKDYRKHVMTRIIEKIDSSDNYFVLHLFPFIYYLIYYSSYINHFKDPFHYGAWYGNDTIWRSTLDLNKIIFYVDKNGKFQKSRQRKMFVLIDAVVAGEGEGPLKPEPIKCNLLIAGDDPLATDIVCCTLMGFDWRKIPTLKNGLNVKNCDLCNSIDDISIVSDCGEHIFGIRNKFNYIFKPASGWKGHIEYENTT